MTVSRPLLRYHGGKWRLAPFILAHLPPHRHYVEPFGGAASVLLRKPRSYSEIYNDLDEEVVALFQVLRDPAQAEALIAQIELTPYARGEFELSYEIAADPLERARRLLVRSWMAHGSSGLRRATTGFRLGSKREYTTPAGDWRNFPEALPVIIDRLRGVYIENRPAADLITRHDGPDTLFYLDPPYVFETRVNKQVGNLHHGYRHELDDAGHAALLAQLAGIEGMAVISGYPCALYDTALAGWTRAQTDAFADRGLPRTEVIWINPRAAAALRADGRGLRQELLFAGAAE